MIKILSNEIKDGICKCFAGRISRLINTSNEFDENIGIENFFANYKQPTKLNMMYEKYFENLMGFVNIYISRLLL